MLPKNKAMLAPFSGQRTKFHLKTHGQAHTMKRYGRDTSGTKTYSYNALGFRGKEFEAEAKHKIFVSGSSYSFGPGVNDDETWPHVFSQLLATSMNWHPNELNLMNFSEGGASNDYVARMAITQCNLVKPDLLIAEFVFKNRSEGFLNGDPFQIGSWLWMNWWDRSKTLRQAPKALKQVMANRLKMINHFYQLYNDEYGFLNILKNILLVQSFCKANNIPYLLVWTEHKQLDDPKLTESPVLSPLLAAIDRRFLCPFGITDEDILTDKGADQAHPGPKTQQIYAQRLIKHFHHHVCAAK